MHTLLASGILRDEEETFRFASENSGSASLYEEISGA
jgi:hypothetical protein